MNREKSLLILGVSARAAAFSALAAGLAPICGDAFADADLRRICPATATERYPAGLAEVARAAPAAPWIYTGALENHPALIARISQARSLLGNGPRVLAAVRDPFAVASALAAAGLTAPALARTSDGLPRDGTWLRKPLHSSGGFGVVPWTDSTGIGPTELRHNRKPRCYFQQRIQGVSCAAIFVAAGGKSQLLGATEQLLMAATPDATEASFRYEGSVGPLILTGTAADRVRRIGDVLTKTFELVGLFGVDYIDDGRDAWPVEVNPRYTASVEILERGFSFSAIDLHVGACAQGQLPGASIANDELATPRAWHAKRVIYASRKGIVDERTAGLLLAMATTASSPAIADIPNAGVELLAGRPILTLFGHGGSRAASLAEIDRARSALAELLPI